MSDNIDRAISLLREAAQSQPDVPELWKKLFSAIIKKSQAREIVDEFRHMVEAAFLRTQLHYETIAYLAQRCGHFDTVESAFNEELRRDPQDATVLYGLGLLLQTMGQQKEAIDVYQRALAVAPKFALVHHNMAVARLVLGRHDEAFESAKEASKCAFGGMVETDYFLGVLFMRRKEFGFARMYFESFLARAPPYLSSAIQSAQLSLELLGGGGNSDSKNPQ